MLSLPSSPSTHRSLRSYELLYGEPPYWAKDDESQLRLIMKHELLFHPDVFDQVKRQQVLCAVRIARAAITMP